MLGERAERAALLLRTVRNLEATQVAHRLRLRGQKVALSRVGGVLEPRWRRAPSVPDWPTGFVPARLDMDCDESIAMAATRGEFCFLNDRRDLGTPIDWRPVGVSQLWSYNLHYWEWAWGLTSDRSSSDPTPFLDRWRSWKAGTRFGAWDEWSPYVVSVRTWVLCNLYGHFQAVLDEASRNELAADLALHGRFVRRNLEFDVGGNHLVKNLKALIAVSVLFSDDTQLASALRLLQRQLTIQVLGDGGHFERSPSYHCQVLFDLVEIADLLKAAGRDVPGPLRDSISRMRSWLAAIVMPDGDVPLFNDCGLVGPGAVEALTLGRSPVDERLTVLAESGYVICRPAPGVQLVIDVGDACPPQLPAHAHADCLSFELSVGGQRAIVDPGTFAYGSGPRRAHDRSTASHNTMEVDGLNQTEVWGAFRAARIAHGTVMGADATDGSITVKAAHDGYRRLEPPVTVERSITISESELSVLDRFVGAGVHQIRSGLNVISDSLRVSAAMDGDAVSLRTSPISVATDFGVEREARRIEWQGTMTEHQSLTWTVAWV
jgi:uncharacterized heparinase superfamily protein